MKRWPLILLAAAFSLTAKADHITGGEMFYSYAGVSNGLYQYQVTLKLFMRCNSGRQFPDPIVISVFNKTNNARVQDISCNITNRDLIQLNSFDPCISDPPAVCYEVAYYEFTVSLPSSLSGYVLASQVNFRIRGINNLQDNGQVGATYTCEIPGSAALNGPTNNSAVFTGTDLVVVCARNFFRYSFAAKDADNDRLRYYFCTAYNSTGSGLNGVPAGDPPYSSLPYNFPDFEPNSPLGQTVQIDPETGLITGIAPPQGVYVVTVCVEEIRAGEVIAVQRKDLQINVADCHVAAAILDPDYMLCRNTRSVFIANQTNSPLIISYDWTVFSPAGPVLYTSTDPVLSYTFPANGKYPVQLIVNKGAQCSDTAATTALVFPGLVPAIDVRGICFTRPTQLTDRSTCLSGSINSWKWDFGEPASAADISLLPNNQYTYPTLGTKNILLTVSTTDGCKDTVSKSVSIIDKPPITLAFRDTLICLHDQLQLVASGTGNFSWTPAANVVNPATPNPIVSPATNTMYYTQLETDGCVNKDSVLVRVVDHVSLVAMRDTIICTGDTIQLRVQSDALRYAWSPPQQVFDPAAHNPFVVTPGNTRYQVTATIGGCSSTAFIPVTAIAYPFVDAGQNDTICYSATAQLSARTDGNSWSWSPIASLTNGGSLQPVAHPLQTTPYVLTVYESTRGCPKPSRDTVFVTVLPKIIPTAGRDTAVVINQPLQLKAGGGLFYSWSPAGNLSNPSIADPIAIFHEASAGLRYQVRVYNVAGCSDSASIRIKVFATLPNVFVPTAFTPDGNGKNDRLKAVAVGMQRVDYFNIYNRWGQLIYHSSTLDEGWDGRINGQQQPPTVYVWTVKAVDFTGSPYFEKGTVTLIR